MTSGLYVGLFGLIVAVGLSNLQYVDMNSPRNQFIVGFATFNSMSVSGPGGWLTNQESNPFGTGNGAEILFALFSSPMIIAFLCAVFLDNTCPGTDEERGLTFWKTVDVSLRNLKFISSYHSLILCYISINLLSLGKQCQ